MSSLEGHQLVSKSGRINVSSQGKGGVDVPPVNQGEVRLAPTTAGLAHEAISVDFPHCDPRFVLLHTHTHRKDYCWRGLYPRLIPADPA